MATTDGNDLPILDLGLPALALDPLGREDVQSQNQPTPRAFRRQARERFKSALKRETLAEILPSPPAAGEAVHIVSKGRWDYFCFIPLILGWIGSADELYGSTWTMSRNNALDLLGFYDAGKVRKVTLASGNYFRARESATANTILEGLKSRGQRFRTWENHAKLILMHNAERKAFYVVEGSANWTANPRTEQNIILNDKGLYEFHRSWLEEMFQ